MDRLIFILVGCCVLSNAATVNYIKPCKPDDKPCMIAGAQSAVPIFAKGVPEFNMPPVEPLEIDNVRNDDKDLKLGFRNMKIHGPSKCKFLDVSRNLAKSTVSLTVDCPLRAVGQYDLKGKMLFLEAVGDGDFEIKTNKVIIKLDSKLKYVDGSDGKKHWKFTGFDYSYDLVEKVHIHFGNLFGGDESRAKPILEILNHSWKEIVTELGEPIIKELLDKAIHIVNKFFHAVPSDNLEIV